MFFSTHLYTVLVFVCLFSFNDCIRGTVWNHLAWMHSHVSSYCEATTETESQTGRLSSTEHRSTNCNSLKFNFILTL